MTDLLGNLALGFSTALSLQNVWLAFIGCLVGTLIGVLPGIGPIATITMLLPITFSFDPIGALIMLAGIYYGAQYGGSTTAILVNIPGEVTAIVTTLDADHQPKGLTSNAVCSVSAEPPLMLVCVDKKSHTLPALRHSKTFVVNYLCAGRGELSNTFASKEPDKFAKVAWRPAKNGMPWLHTDSLAYAECTTVEEIDAGDHVILLARVDDGQAPAPGTQPLMYFRRSYASWSDKAH